MSGDADQVTAVKIYNQVYQVRSGNDSGYVKRLAEHVDERMREVFEGTATVDSSRVAVLAALNIADEYFAAKHRLDMLEHVVVEKSEEISSLLLPVENSKST